MFKRQDFTEGSKGNEGSGVFVPFVAFCSLDWGLVAAASRQAIRGQEICGWHRISWLVNRRDSRGIDVAA